MTIKAAVEDRNDERGDRNVFALWSEVYDEQPNPLLSLEEDFLFEMLPEVSGLDVADVGCGTGRWLQHLTPQRPRSLTGIDASSAMLARARTRVGRAGILLLGDCLSLPIADDSADLLLASFVLSHVADVDLFASELSRVVRPGGSAFITDAHPETVSQLGWKRAFTYAGSTISLQTHDRSMSHVISALRAHGFEIVCLLEPSFQSRQQELFRRAGKSQVFASSAGFPAIYLLQVRRQEALPSTLNTERDRSAMLLAGARVAIGPRQSARANLAIEEGALASIGNRAFRETPAATAPAPAIDLSGYLLLPGLINSHDHLEFGLFPNLGRGNYRNASEWAADIQSRETTLIGSQQQIPKDVRCWWGAIRNLLGGATTVCHHNPTLPEFFSSDFPVRVIRDIDWAHSLAIDPDAAAKFPKPEAKRPFVIHAAEGVDKQSSSEIFDLDRLHMLDDRTILVHGVALDGDGISLLNRRGATLVWCPTSNRFLFGRTHDRKFLGSIQNLVLGSDSPLTAAGDLLDEIRFARDVAGVLPDDIYRMVFTRPAQVFGLEDGEGTLRAGGVADLIAIRDTGADPCEALVALCSADIELVMLAGRVQLAREPILNRLPASARTGLEPLEVDHEVLWLRAPLVRLFQAASASMDEIKLGQKRLRYAGVR